MSKSTLNYPKELPDRLQMALAKGKKRFTNMFSWKVLFFKNKDFSSKFGKIGSSSRSAWTSTNYYDVKMGSRFFHEDVIGGEYSNLA